MEPVSAFLLLVLVGMNGEIADNKEEILVQSSQIAVLEMQVDDMEQDYLSLVGKLSAMSAYNKVEHARLTKRIQILEDEINSAKQKLNYVDEKVKIYHD